MNDESGSQADEAERPRSYANAEHLAFVAARTPQAQEALAELEALHPAKPPADADVIVALGGDGFMLHTLHEHLGRDVAVFGMNRGTIGFLMNGYDPRRLLDVGELCLQYGGGGHEAAGTCQVAHEDADRVQKELIDQINDDASVVL